MKIKIFVTVVIVSGLFLMSLNSQGQSKIVHIKIKGGGGYHTETRLKFSFSCIPISIKGEGTSDANDGTPRVGISTFNGNYYDFNGKGWVDLSRFASRNIYVILNSKWGTEKDTYMELNVEVPYNCNVSYSKIDHNYDDLDYVRITEESIHSKTFQIKIKGGGGYYTETRLRFSFSCMPISIKGEGTSDANDGTPRVGISTFNGNYYDFNGKGWVDLSRFASRNIYVILNSKWGTDKDTYMELRIKVPDNCNVSYTKIDNNYDDLDYVRIRDL